MSDVDDCLYDLIHGGLQKEYDNCKSMLNAFSLFLDDDSAIRDLALSEDEVRILMTLANDTVRYMGNVSTAIAGIELANGLLFKE